MRVLVIAPFGNPRCGEAETGRNLVEALQGIGVEATAWDGYWPTVYHRGTGHQYMPEPAELATYDLVHIIWGPANLGHYLPEHFPPGIPLSVFLCDVPPHVSCPLWDRADLLVTVHGHEDETGAWVADVEDPRVALIEQGVPAVVSRAALPPLLADAPIRIGVTGIRSDSGRGVVEELCAKRGWELAAPDPGVWLSTQDEIARLAACHVLVCWYHENQRGVSMGASFCIAARRPMVLSCSRMFNHLRRWSAEFYWEQLGDDSALETYVDWALDDLREGRARLPWRASAALIWPAVALDLRRHWVATIERVRGRGARG